MSDSSTNSSRRFTERLSIFTNLAVVAGIIFVAMEIRQNTAMMQAQMNQSRTDTALSEQQAGYNSEYMPAIEVKVMGGEQLSDEEAIRYELWFRAFNRNMDNQQWQHRRGFLGANIPRSVRKAVREMIGSSELGVAEWDRQKLSFSDEYIALVDEAIADLRDQWR